MRVFYYSIYPAFFLYILRDLLTDRPDFMKKAVVIRLKQW